jgi:hypothetical protein
VRAALQGGSSVVLAHEMDHEQGIVPFRVFFANTSRHIRHGRWRRLISRLHGCLPLFIHRRRQLLHFLYRLLPLLSLHRLHSHCLH